MKSNVGGIDKVLRIVVGAGLIGGTVAGFLPVWGYIGVVPLLTDYGLMEYVGTYARPIMGPMFKALMEQMQPELTQALQQKSLPLDGEASREDA